MFTYKVEYWDSATASRKIEKGIIGRKNFTKAMRDIQDWYDGKMLYQVYLKKDNPIGEGELYDQDDIAEMFERLDAACITDED